jgi:DNA (cytosine-5)-methyltransferase 1
MNTRSSRKPGSSSRPPNVLDLFSGCGGMSAGFRRAGCRIVAGIDADAYSISTYRHNFPEAEAISMDLSVPNVGRVVARRLAGIPIDIVVAGPPCQGFSLTGTRDFDDPRNALYTSVIKVVAALKPMAFVIENVRGMASLYGGRVCKEVVSRFESLGFSVSLKVVCAADFGVPQFRKRLFFVGVRRSHGRFKFPDATHGPESGVPRISCRAAIGDLPSLSVTSRGAEESEYRRPPFSDYQAMMRGGSDLLLNHVATKHTDLVVQVIAQVPPGGDHRDLPPGVGTHRRFNEAWTRYHPDRPSHTIDTGHRNHFHYRHHRVPTVRENARLQSFHDSFRFLGPRTSQYRQVGNAVPPLLAEAIARALIARNLR